MTAVNIYLQASLVDVCLRLIITLPMFYVIGYFTQRYIRKKILKPPEIEVYDGIEDEEDILGKEPTLMDDEPLLHDEPFLHDESLLHDEPLMHDDLLLDGDLPQEDDTQNE